MIVCKYDMIIVKGTEVNFWWIWSVIECYYR
jgi:hypothetical protein